MQFPTDRLLLLRGGIPPIIGDKIFYFKSRFFKKRVLPPPVVLPLEKQANQTIAPPPFRDMTPEELEGTPAHPIRPEDIRSEEHTSELQSLMRNSYAVFCLKKKNYNNN